MTTPWPINSLQRARPNGEHCDPARRVVAPMMASLFSPCSTSSNASFFPGDTALSIRSKGVALLEHSTYMARRAAAGDFSVSGPSSACAGSFSMAPVASPLWDGTVFSEGCIPQPGIETPAHCLQHTGIDVRLCDEFYKRFNTLDAALQRFLASLPPLRQEDLSSVPSSWQSSERLTDIDTSGEDYLPSMQMQTADPNLNAALASLGLAAWSPAHSARTHTLITGHSLALASTVQLHAILCETSPASHVRMLEGAMRTAELTRLTLDLDVQCFQILVIVSFISVHFL